MNKVIVPLYVLILVIAIPQLSETIYVPALPAMSEYFNVSANVMELTLTTYLLLFYSNHSAYFRFIKKRIIISKKFLTGFS